jgi:hypothetical protein
VIASDSWDQLATSAAANAPATAITIQTVPTPDQTTTCSPSSSEPSTDRTPTEHHPSSAPNLSNEFASLEATTHLVHAIPTTVSTKSTRPESIIDPLPVPISPHQPDNFEVAAVGGIKILDDEDSNFIDAQLASEYSQTTLDYYNDIQEYLQQANIDETGMKKKKKKKKKKKSNPTSTPENPILFYV